MLSIELIVVRRVKTIPRWIIPIIAFLAGTLIAIVLLYVLTSGQSSPALLVNGIINAILTPQLLLKNFALLTIVGIGLLISFKASIWNIGGEGQFYFAIVAATWVALFSGLGKLFIINKFLMLLLGVFAAGLWALIASLPRAFLGVDEVPVTLLMNYIAYYIVDYLVFGPWREPQYRYARTSTLPVESWFVNIPGTTLTFELLILTITAIMFAWFFLNYTRIGLAIKVMGSNPHVLRVVGINIYKIIMITLTLSGMIVGIAGVSYLAGEAHLITIPAEERTPVLGYTGILVAWLSMLEIIYVPIAAYIVSVLLVAGINIQITGAGGFSITNVFIGSILLAYSILVIFSEYKVKIVFKKR